MPDVSFSGKEKRSSWESTWDLVNTSQMFLPLSHWTHGGGVEASLATARLEAWVTSAVRYTAYNFQMGIPCGGECGPGVDWLYNHIA